MASTKNSRETYTMMVAVLLQVNDFLRTATHARHISTTKHHLRHANHAHLKFLLVFIFKRRKNSSSNKTTILLTVHKWNVYNGICTFAILVHLDLCVIYWTFHVMCLFHVCK